MIHLDVIGYSASWGPVPWVYVGEIFPTRLRAYGVGLGSATQWLFNFVITYITPAAINDIGWRTFVMFGIFCFAMGVSVFLFVRETKGRSLEETDALFTRTLALGCLGDEEHRVDAKLDFPKAESETVKHVEASRV